MLPDSFWRGRLWGAARIGVPAGAAYVLIQFATGRTLAHALLSALIFAAVFGPAMSIIEWHNWPGARGLNRRDRIEVAGVVRRGQRIADPRLALAVLDYGQSLRKAREREQRFGWVLWVFAALTFALAVRKTVAGPVHEAVVWWALVVFWVGFMVWQPRRRARVLSRVSRAEAAATQLLGPDHSASGT
jgi:hypothetical protein